MLGDPLDPIVCSNTNSRIIQWFNPFSYNIQKNCGILERDLSQIPPKDVRVYLDRFVGQTMSLGDTVVIGNLVVSMEGVALPEHPRIRVSTFSYFDVVKKTPLQSYIGNIPSRDPFRDDQKGDKIIGTPKNLI